MIGIIGAMQIEIDGLVEKLNDKNEVNIFGFKFVSGKLFNKEVVACCCGIGKVNSSSAASVMICSFKNLELLVNIGVAGGIMPGIRQGDIVVSSAAVQHDYKVPDNERRGHIAGFDFVEFTCDSSGVERMERVLKELKYTYYTGIIASGDEFIDDKKTALRLNSDFNAFACDMETAAIAHVCHIMKVKYFAMRAISDNADGTAVEAFNEFALKAAVRSINAIIKFIEASI